MELMNEAIRKSPKDMLKILERSIFPDIHEIQQKNIFIDLGEKTN